MSRRDDELRHIASNVLDDKAVARRLKSIQDDSYRDVQERINNFIALYAAVEGISIAEVRRRASKADVEAYRRRLNSMNGLSSLSQQELRLYNVTMEINRLELLKANIWIDLVSAGNEMERLIFQSLIGVSVAEFERQAGILGKTVGNTQRRAEALANASFKGVKWSERIWTNQDALRLELDKQLRRGIMQGVNSRVLSREIRREFNVTTYQAERIMRTEKARVQVEAQKISFEESGYTQYEYIAEMDACKTCADLDGKIFDVDKMEAGTNAAPMHPNCRCSTAAYMDRASFEADLERRGL